MQYFGSAPQLTLHFHARVPDGVFVAVPPPTPEEVTRLVQQLAQRVAKLLRKRGLDDADGEVEDALDALRVAAVTPPPGTHLVHFRSPRLHHPRPAPPPSPTFPPSSPSWLLPPMRTPFILTARPGLDIAVFTQRRVTAGVYFANDDQGDSRLMKGADGFSTRQPVRRINIVPTIDCLWAGF